MNHSQHRVKNNRELYAMETARQQFTRQRREARGATRAGMAPDRIAHVLQVPQYVLKTLK